MTGFPRRRNPQARAAHWGGSGGAPLTPALLRLDPMLDPLRGDPGFEKIVASLAPKTAEK